MVKQPRQIAPKELSDGYAVAAQLAEQRRAQAAARGDRKEAGAWKSIATYCRTMAQTRRIDAPDSDVAYVPPTEEIVINLRVLSKILERSDKTTWSPEKKLALNAALHVLSPTERVVAVMFYGGLLETVHIANALRTTKGTIEAYLNRIRKKWDKLREDIV